MLAPTRAFTRLQAPRVPAGCITRPVLQRRLREAVLAQPLVLLCAPAGFGKTTALAQLAPGLPAGTAIAWVGIDEDESLPRFLAGLCAALSPLRLRWHVAPEALATLALAERGLRAVADALVNALAGADVARGLLVLEDTHRVADGRVFELLRAVLERLPHHWSLVITSRAEPPLALARQRACGALAEFRQPDLQFDRDEVDALLAAHGPAAWVGTGDDSADNTAQALLDRTQGWAAGLRLSLAAWSAQPGASGALMAQRHLFDFLADEVLADMPPRLREFLLHAAILPVLSAERAAEVTGMADAAELLDEIERRELFVSVLGDQPLVLRLHDLFRGFLEDRLLREHVQALPALCRRAAASEPDLARAVGYLARAEDWPAALARLLQHGPGLLAQGDGDTLDTLLGLFPASLWPAHPDLWLLKGLTAWPRYDFDALLDCMRQAVAGYERDGRMRDAALASAHLCAGLQHAGQFDEGSRILAALNELALDDAALAFIRYGAACDAVVCGRAEGVAPRQAQMLTALERVPDPGLWQTCPLQLMLIGAPGTVAHMGRHADALLRLAADAPSGLRAAAWHARCWQALLAGRFDEAAQWLDRADADTRWIGRPRLVQTDQLLSRLLLAALRGDRAVVDEAGRALIDDIRHASPSFRRVHEPAMLFAWIRAAWLLQDVPTLERLASELEQARHADEWPSARSVHPAARALLALAHGRLAEADIALAQIDEAFACHFLAPAPQMHALRAWVALQQGRADGAAALLQPLLDVLPAGEAVAIVFAGAPALGALAAAPWGTRLSESHQACLREMAARAQRARAAAPTPTPAAGHAVALPPATPSPVAAPLQALTPREQEVLGHLALGDSNKLIARRLALSEHTVKQHVASILGKLSVQTRGQAAAWQRARGGA